MSNENDGTVDAKSPIPAEEQVTRFLAPDVLDPTELEAMQGRVQFDEWSNPLQVPQRFEINVRGPVVVRDLGTHRIFDRAVRRRYVVGPGETVRVPACHRRAIQTTNVHGMVVGGVGMHLLRVGESNPAPIHPAMQAPVRRGAPVQAPLPAPVPMPSAAPVLSLNERLLARARASK
jgi:hypothetical protein